MRSAILATPYSGIKQIAWPAIPGGLNASALAVLFQLEQTQWWSQKNLQQAQFRQLAELLSHSLASVPHYQNLRDSLSWRSGDDLDPAIWQQIPILTRRAVQQAGEALKSGALDSKHGKVGSVHTSGSTGTPVKISKTMVSNIMFVAFSLRHHFWHRRDISQKFCLIRTFPDGIAEFPDGARQPHWGENMKSIYPSGHSAALAITATIEQQAEWLLKEKPTYLLSFPSVVEGLARYCLDKGKQIPGLTQISTLGENLEQHVRDLAAKAWGVAVKDMYSAQELGYMALQCPDTDHYHVQSESVYLEVLNDKNEPCKAGEIGRVVATPLHNFAMPLLRYEVGDYAEVGATTCSCGRGLPVINRFLGRTRNILTLPDGGQLWPRLSELLYETVVPIRQFQVVQKTLQNLEVNLVPERAVTQEEEAKLAELICSRIGHSFQIDFSYHEVIPRSKSGKYEDFKSELTMQ